MKSIQKILKKNSVFVIFFVIVGLILSLTISYFLMAPRFFSYLKIQLENKNSREELAVLEKNIRDTMAIDTQESSKFFSLVEALIPEEEDTLRVITLTERIAKSSGVVLKQFDTNSMVVVPGTQAAPSPTPPTEGENAGVGQQSQSGTNQTQTTTPATSLNSYKIKVTVEGSFSNVTRFISNYLKTDRLLGMSEVSINSLDQRLSVVLTIELPLSPSISTVSIGDNLVLSDLEREQLKELENKEFTASPANNPLGPANPFK